jgi:hypothetical protein
LRYNPPANFQAISSIENPIRYQYKPRYGVGRFFLQILTHSGADSHQKSGTSE